MHLVLLLWFHGYLVFNTKKISEFFSWLIFHFSTILNNYISSAWKLVCTPGLGTSLLFCEEVAWHIRSFKFLGLKGRLINSVGKFLPMTEEWQLATSVMWQVNWILTEVWKIKKITTIYFSVQFKQSIWCFCFVVCDDFYQIKFYWNLTEHYFCLCKTLIIYYVWLLLTLLYIQMHIFLVSVCKVL